MRPGTNPPAAERQTIEGLSYATLRSLGDWRDYVRESAPALSTRRQYEESLLGETRFVVHGNCYSCRSPVPFAVDYAYAYPIGGVLTPNWREQLVCPRCVLNSRMRGALHLFEAILEPPRDARILIAEQTTTFYRRLAAGYDNLIGFEYLADEVPRGQPNALGIRNESLTSLTFERQAFDHVLAFDVLEHIPDFRKALRECARVLRPGGGLVMSVPFQLDADEHVVRARYADTGEIEHVLPPEYHGDPLNQEGCLAFYYYGWRLLDDLTDAGFSSAVLCHFWSQEYCYLGMNQCLLIARK